MAKGLFGGLFGGQGLQMVGKLTKQNMEKLQASKPQWGFIFQIAFLLNFSYIQVLKISHYGKRNQLCNILYTYHPYIDHIHIWLKKG